MVKYIISRTVRMLVLIDFVNQFTKHGMNNMNIQFTNLPKLRRHLLP